MQKTIKPLININSLTLFFTFIGIASLTLGYMYASRKPLSSVNVISSDELQAKMKSGKVAIVNVLSRKTFDDGHIVGSINIPLNNLRTKARQLFDKNQHLVVYCASVDCHASQKAAQTLSRAGFRNVFAYEGGMKDWYTKKLPTEGPCTMRYLYNGGSASSNISKIKSEKRVKSSKKKPQRYRKATKKNLKKDKKSKKQLNAVSSMKTKTQQGMKSETRKSVKASKAGKARTSSRGTALKKKGQTTQKKKNKRLKSLIVTSPKTTVESSDVTK